MINQFRYVFRQLDDAVDRQNVIDRQMAKDRNKIILSV